VVHGVLSLPSWGTAIVVYFAKFEIRHFFLKNQNNKIIKTQPELGHTQLQSAREEESPPLALNAFTN
jgi:hypothetical protein